jgi:hypothetical protein
MIFFAIWQWIYRRKRGYGRAYATVKLPGQYCDHGGRRWSCRAARRGTMLVRGRSRCPGRKVASSCTS